MILPSRIPCAPRPSERSLRVPRRRKPALESLEGRTLLSGDAAGLAPMPPALVAHPAAIADGPVGAMPLPPSMVWIRVRMGVAD